MLLFQFHLDLIQSGPSHENIEKASIPSPLFDQLDISISLHPESILNAYIYPLVKGDALQSLAAGFPTLRIC
jgi:hypothetical protein